jgi:hypothetical protein
MPNRQKLEGLHGFPFLKGCLKRVCYKSLQGGRVNTWEKIKKTLHDEERLSGKDLTQLAKAFHEAEMIHEFDCLNAEISTRFEDSPNRTLHVFTPLSSPIALNP